MAILSWLQEKIVKKYAGNLIRHGLTTLAGILSAAAFPGAAQLADVLISNLDPLSGALTAVAVFLIGLLLSIRNSKK